MIQDEPIIRMIGVHKAFDSLVVLAGIDLEISRGKTTVVIGPSGCGKSVLLKHVVGLLKPDRGEVWFRHHCISSLAESGLVRVRRRMGFLFQGGALFDSMTVQENVCFPLAEHHVGTDESRIDRSRQVLDLVGLNGLQGRYP
ncbi:MAG: ATP-binding cassette domain-containing protein [Phycisphaerae bacterium]|nr:ATP-binding cassette domain-containing protein [Phycisphaerae bacterium]